METVTRIFDKEFMLKVLEADGEPTEAGAKMVNDKIIDHTRWSVVHDIVFLYEGKFYRTHYSRGATENQDELPWEYQKEVVCYEVRQRETTIIDYVLVEMKLDE